MEAQKILDIHIPDLNFHSILFSEHIQDIQLKSLLQTLIQVGLYKRFIKKFPAPHYLAGNSNGDSSLKVCSGKLSLNKMVEKSAFVESMTAEKKNKPLRSQSTPVLSGRALNEYSIYQLGENSSYQVCESEFHDMDALIKKLFDFYEVQRLITIGPGGISHQEELLSLGRQVVESIELDPMLSWFWPQVQQMAR